MIRTMFVVETKVTCKDSETEWSLLVAYNADTILYTKQSSYCLYVCVKY